MQVIKKYQVDLGDKKLIVVVKREIFILDPNSIRTLYLGDIE